MATRSSRSKINSSLNSETLAENIVRSNIASRSRKRHHEGSDCESDESDQTSFSLDVLAQVASATLQKEPCRKSSPKKIPQRSIQSKEALKLDQIKLLSEKSLIRMFSMTAFNEISKNYTYTCFLMPTVCKETYTSFGNEAKAKAQMKSHLFSHVAQLEDDERKTDPSVPFEFTAEPVNVWKRRIARLNRQAKLLKRKSAASGKVSKKANTIKNQTFTKLKQREKENNLVSIYEFEYPVSEEEEGKIAERIAQQWNETKRISVVPQNKQFAQEHKTRTKKDIALALKEKIIGKKRSENKVVPNIKEEDVENDDLVSHMDSNLEGNETMDAKCHSSSFIDHCYTSVFGRKQESMETDELSEENSDKNSIIYLSSQGSHLIDDGRNKSGDDKKEPILHLPTDADLSSSRIPLPCGEEIVGNETVSSEEEEIDPEQNEETEDNPYYSLNEEISPDSEESNDNDDEEEEEEEAAVAEDEQDIDVDEIAPEKKFNVRLSGNKPRSEWEKKLALKYIKDLKNRKRVLKNGCLSCKICKDKTFTASATLMYHYRSHAGIKPFVCLICNTTFTRQHSLNYHMLIHNNQSRFTCKDCGRKFRHPSHFKEHMRRHTGETPYVCGDCPQKFKTRNTYKRHLKTRHGKLLTASGIETMSKEEFLEISSQRGRKSKTVDEVPKEQKPLPGIISQLPNTQTFPVATSANPQEMLNFHVLEGGGRSFVDKKQNDNFEKVKKKRIKRKKAPEPLTTKGKIRQAEEISASDISVKRVK